MNPVYYFLIHLNLEIYKSKKWIKKLNTNIYYYNREIIMY